MTPNEISNEISSIAVAMRPAAAPCCAALPAATTTATATATSGGGHPAAGVAEPLRLATLRPATGCHVIAGMAATPFIGHVVPALLRTQPGPDQVAVFTLTGGGLGAFGLVSLPDPARLRHRLGSELAEDMAITVPLLDLAPLWPRADRAVIVGWGEAHREPDLRRIADLAPVPVDAAVRVHNGRWWRLDCPAPGTCPHLPCTAAGEPLDDGGDHHHEPDVPDEPDEPVGRVGDHPEGGGECAVESDVSHPDRVTTSGGPIHARHSDAAHHPDSADTASSVNRADRANSDGTDAPAPGDDETGDGSGGSTGGGSGGSGGSGGGSDRGSGRRTVWAVTFAQYPRLHDHEVRVFDTRHQADTVYDEQAAAGTGRVRLWRAVVLDGMTSEETLSYCSRLFLTGAPDAPPLRDNAQLTVLDADQSLALVFDTLTAAVREAGIDPAADVWRVRNIPVRNALRALRIRQPLAAFARAAGLPDDEPLAACVQDFLIDLMHLATLLAPPDTWPDLLSIAERRHHEEVAGA